MYPLLRESPIRCFGSNPSGACGFRRRRLHLCCRRCLVTERWRVVWPAPPGRTVWPRRLAESVQTCSLQRFSFGIEQWEFFQEQDIIAICGVTLRQDSHAACNYAACLIHQVEITSSRIRIRLPLIFWASAPSIYSFCSPSVVMERSTASNTPFI